MRSHSKTEIPSKEKIAFFKFCALHGLKHNIGFVGSVFNFGDSIFEVEAEQTPGALLWQGISCVVGGIVGGATAFARIGFLAKTRKLDYDEASLNEMLLDLCWVKEAVYNMHAEEVNKLPSSNIVAELEAAIRCIKKDSFSDKGKILYDLLINDYDAMNQEKSIEEVTLLQKTQAINDYMMNSLRNDTMVLALKSVGVYKKNIGKIIESLVKAEKRNKHMAVLVSTGLLPIGFEKSNPVPLMQTRSQVYAPSDYQEIIAKIVAEYKPSVSGSQGSKVLHAFLEDSKNTLLEKLFQIVCYIEKTSNIEGYRYNQGKKLFNLILKTFNERTAIPLVVLN